MTKALEATTFPKWKGEIDPETNLWLDIEIKLYANHKLLPNLKNVEPISILRNQLFKSVAIYFEPWHFLGVPFNHPSNISSLNHPVALRIPSWLGKRLLSHPFGCLRCGTGGMQNCSNPRSASGSKMEPFQWETVC